MKKIFTAFTLAEILITLSIIGVIAAMVIPSLVYDIHDAQMKAAWKMAYADINQAVSSLRVANAGTLKGVFTDHNSMKDAFKPYLSYIKDCNYSESNGVCWYNTEKWYRLNGTINPNSMHASLVLNNGGLIAFWFDNSNCTQPIGTSGLTRCGSINVDVNGFKGPNTIGKDIFGLHVLANSVKPFGIQGDMSVCITCLFPPESGWTDVNNYGWACSAKYITE